LGGTVDPICVALCNEARNVAGEEPWAGLVAAGVGDEVEQAANPVTAATASAAVVNGRRTDPVVRATCLPLPGREPASADSPTHTTPETTVFT
jgi:hypothetical protein